MEYFKVIRLKQSNVVHIKYGRVYFRGLTVALCGLGRGDVFVVRMQLSEITPPYRLCKNCERIAKVKDRR